ncbi:MAG: M1 family metallopeptidase, partial [Bacteroidota bacterium]|nr:M1 family metallopeptidase [Bacteroidota bacterium]
MKILFLLKIIAFILFMNTYAKGQESKMNAAFSCKHLKQQALEKPINKPSYSLRANNERSDTIDILNYTINLDITDFTNQIINGNCEIKFTPKINNINSISLDLLQLTVDSITLNNALLNYVYNDTLLIVNFNSPLNSSDTSSVTVYYRGTPQGDASGWGGFYFQNGYAFNLGVGFAADPHNYGRVWFPCFDNFVERSTYEFNILTSNNKKAICNGELTSEVTIGQDSIVRTWKMQEEIPTYLACVAVANYAIVNKNHIGVNGNIPIMLAALPGDTTNLKNSFANLGNAIDAFEQGYGPYLWNKVGYSLVPFSSGAMEHATNIAYPRATATGSLAYETLMAHELAHHWWGDLVTCETAEDMWINEGMASYSEQLFTQYVYGQSAYLNSVKSNL